MKSWLLSIVPCQQEIIMNIRVYIYIYQIYIYICHKLKKIHKSTTVTFSWLKSVSTIQHLFFSKRTSHLWIWSVHPHNPPPHHHYLHLDFFFTATLAVVPKARLGFRLVFTAKPHLPPEVHTRKPAEALEAGGSNYRLPDPVAAVRFMDFWMAKFVFRHSEMSFLENEGENVLSSNF